MVSITKDGKIKSNPDNEKPKIVFVVEILYYKIVNIPKADVPLKTRMDSDIQFFRYYEHAFKYVESKDIRCNYPNFYSAKIWELNLNEIDNHLEDW